MVVFTCQKCNSTLKKNAVEKHNTCRPFYLTCIDCLKDFRGKEYEEHKSCITEAQKYGGSNTVCKPHGVKQANWFESAKLILEKLSHSHKYKKICRVLKESSNIPRQRKKFHNFVKSSCPGLYNPEEVNEIFDHLEGAKDSNKNECNTDLNDSKSILEQDESAPDESALITENSDKKKKKKKKKKDLEISSIDLTTTAENGTENSISVADISENSMKGNESLADDFNAETKDKEKKKRPLIEAELQTREEKCDIKKRKKDGKKVKVSLDEKENQQNKENEENCQDNENDQNNSFKNGKNDENVLSADTKMDIDMSGLSKKERKKLKKQKKYMAELVEIENFQPEKEEEEEVKHEEKVKKKKKKNTEADAEASSSVSPKRKHEEENKSDDLRGKKIKLNETLPEEEITIDPGKKFKWSNVIKQVLENSPNNELPLKKLRKKVMNEYKVQKGEDVPYEKLLGIFNKKINNIVGVKILKDKAQLSV